MELSWEWIRGLRFGLWYFDFGDDEEWGDVPWSLGICLDLGVVCVQLYSGLKEQYKEDDF